MSEWISKEAVLRICEDEREKSGDIRTIISKVKRLPIKCDGGWISVEERLPELGERVLCTDGYAVFEQYRTELSIVYGTWDRNGLKSPLQGVTHWMPLPALPKEEKNAQ